MNNIDKLGVYLRDQFSQVLSVVNVINSRIVQNNANLAESENERNRIANQLSETLRNSELQANNKLGSDLVTQDTNWSPQFQVNLKTKVLQNLQPPLGSQATPERCTSLLETIIPFYKNSTQKISVSLHPLRGNFF